MRTTEERVAELDSFAKANFRRLKDDFLDAHTGITEEQYEEDHDATVDSMIEDVVSNLKQVARKKTVIAHRIIFARKVSPELGRHWSLEPLEEGNVEALLAMVQRTDPTLTMRDAKVVTARIPTSKIDLIGTLQTNARFPYEEEILLRTPLATTAPKTHTRKRPARKKHIKTPLSLQGVR